MSDYARANTGGSTHFTDKDGLTTGDPDKLIVGSEHDAEFNAALTAINTKYDSSDIANQAESEAGTSGSKVMSPEGVQFWGDDNGGMIGEIRLLADPGADGLLGWDDSASAGSNVILFTGGTGIDFSAATIALDLVELTTEASIAAGDFLAMVDITDNGSGKITFANLEGSLALANLSDYDANDHIDHTTVSVVAGAGMTGGGTIAANRTLNVIGTAPVSVAADAVALDISGLSALTSETLAVGDTFLIDDGDGGTNKKIAFQDFGPKVVESDQPGTLAATDGNTMFVNTGSVEDTITIPLDAAADLNIGFQIGICTQGTAAVLVAAGGTTVNSLNSNLQVKGSGGGAYLIKTGADIWSLIGDLEA